MSGGGRPVACIVEPGLAGILGADRDGGPGAGLFGNEGAGLLLPPAGPAGVGAGEDDLLKDCGVR